LRHAAETRHELRLRVEYAVFFIAAAPAVDEPVGESAALKAAQRELSDGLAGQCTLHEGGNRTVREGAVAEPALAVVAPAGHPAVDGERADVPVSPRHLHDLRTGEIAPRHGDRHRAVLRGRAVA